jgi:hypothetical protein
MVSQIGRRRGIVGKAGMGAERERRRGWQRMLVEAFALRGLDELTVVLSGCVKRLMTPCVDVLTRRRG